MSAKTTKDAYTESDQIRDMHAVLREAFPNASLLFLAKRFLASINCTITASWPRDATNPSLTLSFTTWTYAKTVQPALREAQGKLSLLFGVHVELFVVCTEKIALKKN